MDGSKKFKSTLTLEPRRVRRNEWSETFLGLRAQQEQRSAATVMERVKWETETAIDNSSCLLRSRATGDEDDAVGNKKQETRSSGRSGAGSA
jgi:hypothetical protein